MNIMPKIRVVWQGKLSELGETSAPNCDINVSRARRLVGNEKREKGERSATIRHTGKLVNRSWKAAAESTKTNITLTGQSNRSGKRDIASVVNRRRRKARPIIVQAV